MDNRKWLKRRYPETFVEVNDFLNDSELEKFRKLRYKLGRIIRPTWDVQLYPVGTLILFKRSNPIRDMNYPMHHAEVKCDTNFTTSGYHSIGIFEGYFKEIYK